MKLITNENAHEVGILNDMDDNQRLVQFNERDLIADVMSLLFADYRGEVITMVYLPPSLPSKIDPFRQHGYIGYRLA